MNTFFIYYFRENNGDNEYIILSDESWGEMAIDEAVNFGYHFEKKIMCNTNDEVNNLPFESELRKS